MEAIAPATSASSASTSGGRSLKELGSDDFLRLLITQLRNQDPMKPMGNEELLRQIASVREIELSSTLTDSLRALSGEQRFGSASSLIGQYVTGAPDESGVTQSGIVERIRFGDGGRPVLQLSNGGELPLDQLAGVEPPIRAAEALIGKAVMGVDRRNPSQPAAVQGVVTGVGTDSSGDVILELDTGQNLRMRDLLSVISTDAA